jgi:hypothetical protein
MFPPVARRPFPNVPNVGGKILVSPGIVTIVATNDDPTLQTQLPAFGDAFVSSQVWSQVSAEYGLGTARSVAHAVGPAMTGTYTTGQLVDYVSALINASAVPGPNGNTIYLLYLPAGASYGPPYGTTTCGYHTSYPTAATTTGDQVATVEQCPPVLGGETELGHLTRIATHEIVEAATDPDYGQGYNLGETPTTTPWTEGIWQSYAASGHVELGDLCEGTREFEAADGGPAGGWEYQRIWSNAAAADGGTSPCIPAPSVYFAANVTADWYALPEAGTLTIPVGGWSTGSTSDWLVKVALDYAGGNGTLAGITDGGVPVTTTIGPSQYPGCVVRPGMTDGTQGTITVSVPPGARSGDFAVLDVLSYHESSTCYPPLSEDDSHIWPFGVYVP